MSLDQSQPLITGEPSLHHQRPESPERPERLGGGEEEEEKRKKMQRYLVAIEYIGTRFAGAQQQPTGRTVVGVLQVHYNFLISFTNIFIFPPQKHI